MTNADLNGTNTVFLRGVVMTEPTLSHELYGEGFYEFTVSVPRLSEQLDLIPVTASERSMAEHRPKVGETVAIEGQFRSYNKVTDGHSRLMLTVFVREFADPDDEYANPNTLELVGYICKTPIYRTTPLSREICDMLVAVNRAFNKSDYLPCIAWGRNARYCRTLAVGTKLRITGRIQSRVYVKKLSDDVSETRTAYEISVSRVETVQSAGASVAATTTEEYRTSIHGLRLTDDITENGHPN